MSKKSKDNEMNLYYINHNEEEQQENIEKVKNKKKNKDREKRIKEKTLKEIQDAFDAETETVINMTNKNKIKKEEQKRKEFIKQQKKRKRRNNKIFLVIKILFFMAIIIGGIAFAFVSPIFNISKVEVLNNNQLSSETIISLSGIQQGENIFKFNKRKVVENVKENSYVEKLEVKRKLPNIIRIDIIERIPTFSVDYMGKYAYINNQGYILEIAEVNKNMPIIQGISTSEEQVVPNNRLDNEDLMRLEDVIKIINIAEENNLSNKVTSIDITNQNDYSIYLEEEKKKVHLGDNSNLSNKMLYVVSIIEETKGKEGDIFVNGDINNKFRTYFREKVEV